MALTAAALAAINQDRGPQYVDPLTKSSIQKVVNYTEPRCEQDPTDLSCDSINYRKLQTSANINELINCRVTQTISGSVSLNVRAGATAAEVTLFLDRLRDDILDQLILGA